MGFILAPEVWGQFTSVAFSHVLSHIEHLEILAVLRRWGSLLHSCQLYFCVDYFGQWLPQRLDEGMSLYFLEQIRMWERNGIWIWSESKLLAVFCLVVLTTT